MQFSISISIYEFKSIFNNIQYTLKFNFNYKIENNKVKEKWVARILVQKENKLYYWVIITPCNMEVTFSHQ